MAKIIQCPQLNTQIGTYLGHPVLARFLASGYDISIPKSDINKSFDSTYKPTCGIEISEMVLFNNKNETIMKESIHVPHDIVCNLMLQYFNETAWSDMHDFYPYLSKHDAFGIYVVNTIPKIIPSWSKYAWRDITINMIKNKYF